MIDGLIVVDKPSGMTSHDVVARMRRICGQRRVGHTGTLDPSATGVLCVAVGRATRLIRFLDPLPKRYVGELVLGSATTTLDADGEVTEVFDMRHVTLDDITNVINEKFIGVIEQIPPMVSAKKIDGKRLHALAREGKQIERRPQRVEIHACDVRPTVESSQRFHIDVTCSTGTYIRSLCDDIGRALGGGAHLRNLRRTQVGPFSIEHAHSLDELSESVIDRVLAPLQMVAHLPQNTADADVIQAIKVGKKIQLPSATDPKSPYVAMTDAHGELLAIYSRMPSDRWLKPEVVLFGTCAN